MKKLLFVCLCALFSFSLTAQQYRVIINELLYDAPVRGESLPPNMHNGEFVSIYNFGWVPVDVSGWRLISGHSSHNQVFTFPQGSIMQPGARFFVAYRSVFEPVNNFVLEDLYYFFQMEENDRVFYQNALRHANSGEELTLRRSNGAIQDRMRYDGTGTPVNSPPLRAINSFTNPARAHVSLQRVGVTTQNDATIVFNPLDWATRPVALNEFSSSSITEQMESVYTNALQGVVDVTPTGALTFTIPIQVPVGTAGMQPQLAIVYNSQSNVNGILGLGFGLSGLSSITRTGRNFYHDGERTGVTLTMDDHFALDGQRLIQTGGSGAIGTDGVIFDTEIASFAEIRSFGHGEMDTIRIRYMPSSGHRPPSATVFRMPFLGPREFHVGAKDGNTLFYGISNNSRVRHLVGNNAVISQWHISRVEDPNGNVIEFEYHPNSVSEGWANQISEIRYGYSPGGGFLNRIVFNYIERPEQNRRILYFAGQPIADHKLLSEIRIYSGIEVVKMYRFQYTADRQRLLYMRKFVPHGGTDRMIGELRFDWSSRQQRFADPVRWTDRFRSGYPDGWNTNYHPRMLADISGDGKADIVGFSHYAVNVGLSSGSDISQYAWWYQGDFSSGSGWNTNRHSRYVLDVNGDGIADVVGFGEHGVYVGLSNGNNALRAVNRWTAAFTANNGWINTMRYPRYLADFDGDGLLDIIGHGTAHTYITLNNRGVDFEGGWIQTPTFAARDWNFGGGSRRLIGDINGDGRADIVVLRRHEREACNCGILTVLWTGRRCPDRHHYSVYFALSHGNSVGSHVNTGISTDEARVDFRFNIFLEDVNGDGKADLVFSQATGLYVALSTGTGFSEPTLWTTSFGLYSPFSVMSLTYILRLKDVNGDGLPDLVFFDRYTVGVALNTGSSFVRETDWAQTSNYWGSFQNQWRDRERNFRTIADVNGDGLPDLIGFDNYGVMVSLNLSGQPMLIGVRDNLGRIFTATYDFLTNSDIYTNTRETNPVAFPLMNFQGPLRVCTRLTTRSSDKRFTYKGAVIHQQGRGFLGFSEISKIDSRTQLKQVSRFRFDSPFYVNLPIETRIYHFANNVSTPISQTLQNNFIQPFGGRRILPLVSQTISRDFLTSVEQRTDFAHDNYGNITGERIYRGLISQAPIAVFATHNTFTRSAGRNVPNRLEATLSYSFYTATPSQRFEQKRRFSYDPKGNLEQRIDRYRSDYPVTTSYTVNSRGLVTEIAVSAPGLITHTQRFGYDPHYRFRTSQTTVGLGTSSQTFNVWGQMLSRTTIGDLTTRYDYDTFGRLRRVTSPEGNTTTRIIRSARNVPGAVHALYVQQDGHPNVESFLDILGRTIKTKSPGPSGIVVVQTQFNTKGLVERTSMPHFANETPRWTTFGYDRFGRLETETFEGLTTKHSRNGLTTTVTPPAGASQASSRTHNAAGDLIRATDAGGTIYYYYYAPGFVRRIVAPGNAVTTITYDPLGRQASLTDPNAGTITFRYDAFDRIISQTNARGYETVNRFDRFGRLERVTEGNRVSTYTYFNSGSNLGRLRSITTNNGTAHIFDYDQFGRIVRFQDVSESNTFITEYTYDRFGRLLTYTFPSGFRLHYTHDANGFKTHIRENDANGRVIWQLGEVNALGQELASLAVGRSRTQTFNEFGQPLTMNVSGLMNYTYTYDLRTGNMLSRRNPFIGQNETFSYDNLNRLTTGITFSPCGNIEWKEGVGYFIYNRERPHAVDTIFGTTRQFTNHDITYTSFQKIESIQDLNNDFFASFIYGPNRQRRQMNVWFGDHILNKHYTQNFEVSYINGIRTETKEHIFSPFGLVAIRNNGQLNAVATDHLGSIVARFNPRTWNYEFFGYTAWGRRYRYENGTKYFFDEKLAGADLQSVPTRILDYFARGFTGHEHLDAFGLINMNGRMYDPVIGRFLSPDPFVPDATFTQDFNRYMYARNNPLTYIDPTGEIVIPVLIGAAVSGTVSFFTGRASGLSGSDLFFHTFASATIGAMSGGIGAAVGGAVASSLTVSGFVGGAISGAAGGFAGGFTSGILTTAHNNTMFGTDNNVWLGGLVGGGMGALGGGITGGVRAVRDGRNFWDGATDVVRFNVRNNIGNLNPHDCVPTTLAEANAFFGGNISYEEWLRISGYIDGRGVEASRRALHSLITDNFQTGDFDASNLRNPGIMREIQQSGNLITVHRPMGFTQNGLPMTHLDNIRSVRFFQNGTVIVRDRLGSFRFSSINNDEWFFFRLLGTR